MGAVTNKKGVPAMLEKSNPTTKKCPMCAEEILLTSVSCEFCGAKFEVTSSGYCQNCHEIRQADDNCQCTVCGNTVLDVRIESRSIEEKVQKPISELPLDTHPEKSIQRKKFPTVGILAGVLVIGIAIVFVWFGKNGVPAVSSLFVTDTPSATMTFTPAKTSTASLTPLPTFTRTPRPTPTVIPDQRILNPANQHLYLYVKILRDWHAARDYCAALGGHLVTIQAPSENKFVYDLAVSGNVEFSTWLGGTDEEEEGTWVWVTGEDWRYHSWRRNNVEIEPDNKSHPLAYVAGDIPNGADYLKFDGWDTTWHDENDVEKYFVCEWEP
jgi:hypothetical protein